MPTAGIQLPGLPFLAWEAPKDPDDVVDYAIDWSDDLDALGSDTITGSTWIIQAGSGLTKDSDQFNTTQTTIMFSGGVAGNWEITNRIVTNGGRQLDQTRILVVQEK